MPFRQAADTVSEIGPSHQCIPSFAPRFRCRSRRDPCLPQHREADGKSSVIRTTIVASPIEQVGLLRPRSSIHPG